MEFKHHEVERIKAFGTNGQTDQHQQQPDKDDF